MKTDSVSFSTTQSVDWIADTLRMLANQLNASVDRIAQDNFGGYGTAPGEIEVVMWGHVGLIGGLKHFRPGSANNDWGVQVYVFDQGSRRDIELVALGESAWTISSVGVLNLGASKEKRDIIAQALRPVATPAPAPSSSGMGANQPTSYSQLSSSSQPASYSQLSASSQSASYSQSSASGQPTSHGQTANPGQAGNTAQSSNSASSQNFDSMQEMIRKFQSKQGN